MHRSLWTAWLNANGEQLSIVVGQASFSLFRFLSEVSMSLDARSDTTVLFLERLVQATKDYTQKMMAYHQLGCVRLLRKEYDEVEQLGRNYKLAPVQIKKLGKKGIPHRKKK
ncbi:unnamed protein product [Amaranthus hypochondriacus]